MVQKNVLNYSSTCTTKIIIYYVIPPLTYACDTLNPVTEWLWLMNLLSQNGRQTQQRKTLHHSTVHKAHKHKCLSIFGRARKLSYQSQGLTLPLVSFLKVMVVPFKVHFCCIIYSPWISSLPSNCFTADSS